MRPGLRRIAEHGEYADGWRMTDWMPQSQELQEQAEKRLACASCAAPRGEEAGAEEEWRCAAEALEQQVVALECQIEQLVGATLLSRAHRTDHDDGDGVAGDAASCALTASQASEPQEETAWALKQRISELEAYARAGQREYEALVMCCEESKSAQLAKEQERRQRDCCSVACQAPAPAQGAVHVVAARDEAVGAYALACSDEGEDAPQEPARCGAQLGATVLKLQLEATLAEMVRLQRSLARKTERVQELEALSADQQFSPCDGHACPARGWRRGERAGGGTEVEAGALGVQGKSSGADQDESGQRVGESGRERERQCSFHTGESLNFCSRDDSLHGCSASSRLPALSLSLR